MSLNDLKAEFSQAYVRAVAHASGYFVDEPGRMLDGDGVDLTVFTRGAGGMVRSPRLDLQLKATADPITEDPFPYDLDVKNYNDLRSSEFQVPRILVVVVVPKDLNNWVAATEDSLILKHCAYFTSLRGEPGTQNKKTKRVFLNRAQRFHVTELQSLMDQVRKGEQL